MYRDTRGRSPGMTVNDCHKLQVLQNRLITGARYGVATADLLRDTNTLSVQQIVAYYTLILIHKITKTGKPAGRLKLRREDRRELQGWRLYNSLSRSLREGDVNIHVQEGSKEVGEIENTYKTVELKTKERKRRGEPQPSK
jgi:hypothetical protein